MAKKQPSTASAAQTNVASTKATVNNKPKAAAKKAPAPVVAKAASRSKPRAAAKKAPAPVVAKAASRSKPRAAAKKAPAPVVAAASTSKPNAATSTKRVAAPKASTSEPEPALSPPVAAAESLLGDPVKTQLAPAVAPEVLPVTPEVQPAEEGAVQFHQDPLQPASTSPMPGVAETIVAEAESSGRGGGGGGGGVGGPRRWFPIIVGEDAMTNASLFAGRILHDGCSGGLGDHRLTVDETSPSLQEFRQALRADIRRAARAANALSKKEKADIQAEIEVSVRVVAAELAGMAHHARSQLPSAGDDGGDEMADAEEAEEAPAVPELSVTRIVDVTAGSAHKGILSHYAAGVRAPGRYNGILPPSRHEVTLVAPDTPGPRKEAATVAFETSAASSSLMPGTVRRIHRRVPLSGALLVLPNSTFDLALEFSATLTSEPTPAMIAAALEQTEGCRAELDKAGQRGLADDMSCGSLSVEGSATTKWSAARIASWSYPAKAELAGAGDGCLALQPIEAVWTCTSTARGTAKEGSAEGMPPTEDEPETFGIDLSEENDAAAGLHATATSMADAAVGTGDTEHPMVNYTLKWKRESLAVAGEAVSDAPLRASMGSLSHTLNRVMRRNGKNDAAASSTSALSTSQINRVLRAIACSSRGSEVVPSLLRAPPAPGTMRRIATGAAFSAPSSHLKVAPGPASAAFEPGAIGDNLIGRIPAVTLLSEGLSFCSAATRLAARRDILQWCKEWASQRHRTTEGAADDNRAVARAWQQLLKSIGAPEDLRGAILDDPRDPHALLFPSRRCISPAPLPPHCGFVPVVLSQQLPAIGATRGTVVLVAPFSSASMAAAEGLVAGQGGEAAIWAASTVLVVTGCTGVPAARFGCDPVPELPKRLFIGASPRPTADLPQAALATTTITRFDGTLESIVPRATPVFLGLRLLGFAETQRRSMMRDNGDGRRPAVSLASLLQGTLQQATFRRYAVLRR